MDKQKLIIVGLPGSGIDILSSEHLRKYKTMHYFSSNTDDNIIDNFLYDYIYTVDMNDINSIYDNNFYIMMYNSIQYNGSLSNEGLTIDEWEEKDILVTTPYEFINIPIQYIKDSIIVWLDCNKEYIRRNSHDGLLQYDKFIKSKVLSIQLFYNIIKDMDYIYFFNEPLERISGICKVLMLGDKVVNNFLIKSLNK